MPMTQASLTVQPKVADYLWLELLETEVIQQNSAQRYSQRWI